MSYINLINNFWEQNELQIFKAGEQRLYFYLLKVFNKSGWRTRINRTNSWIQGELGMSYNSLKRAREGLKTRGMIHFRAKNGVANVIYSLQPLPDENTGPGKGADIPDTTGSEAGTGYNPGQTPTPAITAYRPDTAATPPSSSLPPVQEQHIGSEPPADGVKRNWEGLKRKLTELKCSPDDYNRIVKLSNYGKIGHPVWKALAEITESKGKINQPVKFILSRINST
ncbi:MAG: hypothetical protein LBR26_13165 [Prevotella sp.]|jgi:hypothetical protein|nr:hypothetical protein [Prevotella sp.]